MKPKKEVLAMIRTLVLQDASISQSRLASRIGVSQATVSRALTEIRAVRGAGGYYCPPSRERWNSILDAIEAAGFNDDAEQLSFAVYPPEKDKE